MYTRNGHNTSLRSHESRNRMEKWRGTGNSEAVVEKISDGQDTYQSGS